MVWGPVAHFVQMAPLVEYPLERELYDAVHELDTIAAVIDRVRKKAAEIDEILRGNERESATGAN